MLGLNETIVGDRALRGKVLNVVDRLPKEKIGIEKGQDCLLNVAGRHFKVTILEIRPDAIKVSFPGKDYPADGMGAMLEFHDDTGFYYYAMEVVRGPRTKGDGVVLRGTDEVRRSMHRDHMRMPTDLTVQVKEQIHVRKYDAALVNLSGGGALIHTDAPFDFSTVIELTLSIPGEPAFTILGQIVHVTDQTGPNNRRMYGVRFMDVDPETSAYITRYIWQRLPELYPPNRG